MRSALVLSILLSGLTTAAYSAPTEQQAFESAVAEDAERAARRERLFGQLKAAQSEEEGRRLEQAIWQFWMDGAPNADARQLVEDGMARRSDYDLRGAEDLLGEAIAIAPTYPEAYNQRAFVRFLLEDFGGALDDLEQTLELEPDHFGALAGLYHVHLRQGRLKAAFGALRQAVGIHPWISERSALPASEQPNKAIEL